MSMRTFCNKCDRDITADGRFHILFEDRRRETSGTKYVNADFCMSCARDVNLIKMLEEAD